MAIQLSPLVKQYYEMKEKCPDAILLFRCGNFYETYSGDAKEVAKTLGITLTRSIKTKDKDCSDLLMAGFPNHALDNYLPRLIRAGFRVAICEPLTKDAKTIAPKYKIRVSSRDALGVSSTETLNTEYETKSEALDAMERHEYKLVKDCLNMGVPFSCGWATDSVYEIVYKTKDNKYTTSYQVIECTTEDA